MRRVLGDCMKRRIFFSLLAGLLVISFIGTSLIADDNNSRDQNDAGSSQGSEIDPDLNQQLITYLENLDETELDPDWFNKTGLGKIYRCGRISDLWKARRRIIWLYWNDVRK